jgi:hypothetical protein
MPEDIDDNQEEMELTDELRGIIIDEDPTPQNRIWMILTVLILITISLSGWLLVIRSHDEKKVLREKLSNHLEVRKMFLDAAAAVRDKVVRKQDLKNSIDTMLTITTTPLRLSGNHQAPHIPERQEALLTILEAWLRLEIIKGFDDDDIDDMAFFHSRLTQLGINSLEYYDNGILDRIPLLQSAMLENRISKKEKSSKSHDHEAVIALKKQLEELKQSESKTIVAPALLLGKWYRYHNDMKNARRCFEVGRKYVEGMWENEEFYLGKRPKKLSALWSEYVGCLEALAEIAFQEKRFRDARSYLVRMFNTPTGSHFFDRTNLKHSRSLSHTQQISNLKHDIGLLKRAIAFPLELSSFPYFNEHNMHIDWNSCLDSIQNAKHQSSHSVSSYIWESLDPAFQEGIVLRSSSEQPSQELKQAIIANINKLIAYPSFYKTVVYEEGDLTEKSKKILYAQNDGLVSKENAAFINRDIIDTAFGPIFSNPYIMSDGSRLHSGLSKQQENLLLVLYEEHIQDSEVSESEKESLKEKVANIYQGKHHTTLHDLSDALQKELEKNLQIIKRSNITYDVQHTALETIRREMQKHQEQEGNIDVAQLLKFKNTQEQCEERILTALELKNKAQANEKAHRLSLSQLNIYLQKQLIESETQLSFLEKQQALEAENPIDFTQPQLAQVEKQIHLNQHYLRLLESLKATQTNVRLTELNLSRHEMDQEISEYQEKLISLSGNAREEIESKIYELEEKRHYIIQEFDQFFTPLKNLVDQIAVEEEKVWEAEKILKQTRHEIFSIIGTTNVPGSLKHKMERRKALLLYKPDKIEGAALYDSEIQILTEEIATIHAKLNILLQKEQFAKETLAAFYPQLSRTNAAGEGFSELSPLQSYLEDQEELIAQYGLLWQQTDLLKDIQDHEKIIYASMGLIDESLTATQELSEAQTKNLSRYMYDILEARKHLKNLHRQLQNTLTKIGSYGIQNRGQLLDMTEMFQMEHDLGLNLKKYRDSFEERRGVLAELHEFLQEKEELESQKLIAIRQRKQELIDELIPRVAEKENLINTLIKKQLTINIKLRELGRNYYEKQGRLAKYREGLVPKIENTEKRIQDINGSIATNSESLSKLTAAIGDIRQQFTKSITSLHVQDLGDLDAVITQQKTILNHLYGVRDLKEGEHYYQAKALWLIGKSFYEESLLEKFEDLEKSSYITASMLEDERRNGKNILNEYNHSAAYTEENFGDVAKEDGQHANEVLWTTFLEKNALDIFENELVKYTRNILENGNESILSMNKQKDIDAFVARARYLSGEIYMKQAIRQIRNSTAPTGENPDALEHLAAAEKAFYHFLEFTSSPLSGESNKVISQALFAAQEFPSSSREAIAFIDDARIYIGIISGLRNDHNQAIDRYRELLTLIGGDINPIHLSEEEILSSGQELFQRINHESIASATFHSLLVKHPLAHELLYRLGKSYQALAEQAQSESLSYNPSIGNPNSYQMNSTSKKALEMRFRKHSAQAISYYSFLVNTHSYSPFRKAATLQRAQLNRVVGNYSGARHDLTSILDDPVERGGTWEKRAMNLKGDIPGELNPGYTYLSFELGKLYLETKDYDAAATAFHNAKESHHDRHYVLRAKINYAQTLKKTKNWAMANYLLNDLVKEKELASAEEQILYPPELILDLAHTQEKLGDVRTALKILKKIYTLAPSQLVINDQLQLKSKYGMTLLKSDYRDIIRPLALATYQSAQLCLSLRNYSEAIDFFEQSEILFNAMPWTEDRILRHRPREEFEAYVAKHALLAKWGQHKTGILEHLYTSFADYRRQINLSHNSKKENKAEKHSSELLSIIKNTISQVQDDQDSYAQFYQTISEFYDREHARLPEVLARRVITEKRIEDKEKGGDQFLYYSALTRLRFAILTSTKTSTADFVKMLLTKFSRDSIEDKLIDDFVMHYGTLIDLDETDREAMSLGQSNIENLLAIGHASTRLTSFPETFLQWTEKQMQATGLDDIFIALSEQGHTLEEVALFRVSLLSHLSDYSSYSKILGIANEHIDAIQAMPPTAQDNEIVWEMAKIGKTSAVLFKDWQKVEEYSKYLLGNEAIPSYVTDVDLMPIQVERAQALLELAKKNYQDAVFVFDEDKKEYLQEIAAIQEEEARILLKKLSENTNNETMGIASRIRAKQMLKESKG